MGSVNETLRAKMEEAIASSETATGLKAEKMILVTESGEPIHYQFGIRILLEPKNHKFEPGLAISAVKAALATVAAFIVANCRQHFVRSESETIIDTEFDTKAIIVAGYMRGSMINPGNDCGPAIVARRRFIGARLGKCTVERNIA